jgi:hypothetical protein
MAGPTEGPCTAKIASGTKFIKWIDCIGISPDRIEMQEAADLRGAIHSDDADIRNIHFVDRSRARTICRMSEPSDSQDGVEPLRKC